VGEVTEENYIRGFPKTLPALPALPFHNNIKALRTAGCYQRSAEAAVAARAVISDLWCATPEADHQTITPRRHADRHDAVRHGADGDLLQREPTATSPCRPPHRHADRHGDGGQHLHHQPISPVQRTAGPIVGYLKGANKREET
jgi:hypothetical protein